MKASAQGEEMEETTPTDALPLQYCLAFDHLKSCTRWPRSCTIVHMMLWLGVDLPHFWNNRKGGTAERGTRREPLPNATQARMDTYPIRIKTGLDTYQNVLFLKSNI